MRFLPSQSSRRRTAERLLSSRGWQEATRRKRERKLELQTHRRLRGVRADESIAAGWPDSRALRGAGPAPPSLAIITLNRLAYAPRPGDVAAFDALGVDDGARLTAWVDQQLAPASIDDSARAARETAANFQTINKTAQELWDDHVVPELEWVDYIRPFLETERTALLRAAYSERQLFEVIVQFWHDHFNVYGEDAGPMFLAYDRDVIRTHALGSFRSLLEAVTRSNAMMEYLDLKYNSFEPGLPNDGLNENFARELLELHTLGADHFYGTIDPSEVPLNQDGVPAGYTDADVTVAARCLSGWTIDDQWWVDGFGYTGQFRYHHPWHDTVNDKPFLGSLFTDKTIPEKDGSDLLDALASHRATALFVSKKLIRRLVADFPSPALIESAADVFQANWQASDQIARVIRHIVLSEDFRTTWGEKVKRPTEIAIGAIRASASDFAFDEDPYGNPLVWNLYGTGHLPFAWHPPNGYPDVRFAWISSSPRVMTWSLCNWLCIAQDDQGNDFFDFLGQTPADLRTPTEIADFWIDRLLQRPMSAPERQVIIDYLANGEPADVDLDFNDFWGDYQRARGVLALVTMSPSFVWR